MGTEIELNSADVHADRRDTYDEEQSSSLCSLVSQVADQIMRCYGRSGSGRASGLRLLGAYLILQTEGSAGLRRRGFGRDSIRLYREKLNEAGVWIK